MTATKVFIVSIQVFLDSVESGLVQVAAEKNSQIRPVRHATLGGQISTAKLMVNHSLAADLNFGVNLLALFDPGQEKQIKARIMGEYQRLTDRIQRIEAAYQQL